jgi:hypothetical protein
MNHVLGQVLHQALHQALMVVLVALATLVALVVHLVMVVEVLANTNYLLIKSLQMQAFSLTTTPSFAIIKSLVSKTH